MELFYVILSRSHPLPYNYFSSCIPNQNDTITKSSVSPFHVETHQCLYFSSYNPAFQIKTILSPKVLYHTISKCLCMFWQLQGIHVSSNDETAPIIIQCYRCGFFIYGMCTFAGICSGMVISNEVF